MSSFALLDMSASGVPSVRVAHQRHDRRMMTFVWKLLALLCLALGAVGVFVPVMPTVPFLILAAAAASRGWPWLDERLARHDVYGPLIQRWRARRAIPRRAKWFATAGMTGSLAMVWWLWPLPPWLQLALSLVLFGVGAWMWSRPDV
jgi:uncharacterized membrane protein YbaN (DUF454 family)